LGKYIPQVCIHSIKWYWKSQSLGNKADYICNGRLGEWIVGLIWDTGECQMVEESRT
jgi:hypothetical protein